MRLYLLRHAKAEVGDPSMTDHQRALTKRGHRASKAMAAYISEHGLIPDLVLCSSATRTRETLDNILPALSDGVQIEIEDDLYSAHSDEILARLQNIPGGIESAMVIGHNPGIQNVAIALVDSDNDRRTLTEEYPTAAMAIMNVDGDSWSSLRYGNAQFLDLVKPRELED